MRHADQPPCSLRHATVPPATTPTSRTWPANPSRASPKHHLQSHQNLSILPGPPTSNPDRATNRPSPARLRSIPPSPSSVLLPTPAAPGGSPSHTPTRKLSCSSSCFLPLRLAPRLPGRLDRQSLLSVDQASRVLRSGSLARSRILPLRPQSLSRLLPSSLLGPQPERGAPFARRTSARRQPTAPDLFNAVVPVPLLSPPLPSSLGCSLPSFPPGSGISLPSARLQTPPL
ncbi:hypothetical protein CDD83_2778 [Cordyceps sp. RAO-2017]|nr:hypothetical protein CDD83_2778 [Cordyceps sp. RAO-2017]